jgi:tRNA-specific 2-thiouridylase
MSGGVDSSVAAHLLKKEGHEVIGVTMKLWECFRAPKKQTCCSVADAMDARNVCEKLGIPHHVIDMREVFRSEVVEYLVKEYSLGRTPNPCIRCNEVLKFDLLRRETVRLFGTDVITTGHYARIACCRDERYSLLKGLDPNKDQSYFLWTLTQAQLAKTLFPVGGLKKDDVRKLAGDADLPVAEKRESQEICFIPDNDYAGFIHDYYPSFAGAPGEFVDKGGKVLGRHEGVHAYTIGQRRGLRFSLGRRQYVVDIDAKNNRVILGDNDDLMKKALVIEGISGPRADLLLSGRDMNDVEVKIRYRHEGSRAALKMLGGGVLQVEFVEPQRAITPGQAAVIYKGDEVLGGGWIKRPVTPA